MRQVQMFILGLLGLFVAFSGCARITTQVVDKPRVDQETQGNRGYLRGSGPAPSPRRATRQMLQADIELPTAEELNPWRRPAAAAVPPPAPRPEPEAKVWQEEPEEYLEPVAPLDLEPLAPEPPASETTYTVQKGDTLEKISKKFYGTTQNWRRIYDANRDVLRSPDRLYPGQKLRISSREAEPSSGSSDFK